MRLTVACGPHQVVHVHSCVLLVTALHCGAYILGSVGEEASCQSLTHTHQVIHCRYPWQPQTPATQLAFV